MPKNSIVCNEQTSTKSSNKTAPSRATAGANKAGGAQVSQPQKNATARAQSHAHTMQEIERKYPRTQAPSIPDTDLDLTRTTLAICEALEHGAIEVNHCEDGVLHLTFHVYERNSLPQKNLIDAVLTGADFARCAGMLMPLFIDKAWRVRIEHQRGKVDKNAFLLFGERQYAFEFAETFDYCRVELYLDAYAVTSDWLAKNVADVFEQLAFEIDMGIAFVNARRERGYFNA